MRCHFCGNTVENAGQTRNKPYAWRSEGRTHTAHAACANRAAREMRRTAHK